MRRSFESCFSIARKCKSLERGEKATCESSLEKEECLKALQDMDSDKTLGTDGLPSEFYKYFGTSWQIF